jgi:hypothetical protein
MATAKILVEIRLRKSLPTTLKAHELSLLGVVGDKLSLAIVSSALNQFAIQASMILSTLPKLSLSSIAALLLATGTAHASEQLTFQCGKHSRLD